MLPIEVLKKKRDGFELNSSEIDFFIRQISEKKIGNEQTAAFVTSCFINGLSFEEIASLTKSMMLSGETFDFSTIGLPVVDKHSTGGVGDKTSILLVPILMDYDVIVPMISGRGLGHTGGTVDKLNSILGFKMDYSFKELNDLIEKNRFFMSSQTESIAPADRRMYHIRDITGNVESIGLITSSILSKKFAEGLDGLALDLKVGNGAFMKNMDEAEHLGETMMKVSQILGVKMNILFTNMHQPLGRNVGNFNEILECEEFLKGKRSVDLESVVFALASEMLSLAGIATTKADALKLVAQTVNSGNALNNFYRMIELQGGDYEKSKVINQPKFKFDVVADRSGFVNEIDAFRIGMCGIKIKAGRQNINDVIDYSAGIEFHKKLGDRISPNDVLATVYGSVSNNFEATAIEIKNSFEISEGEPIDENVIIKEWRNDES